MSVYFISARQVGLVKIGCADDPYERLSTLQTSSPIELAMEAILKGSYAEEKQLHARFAVHRVRGEWFKIVPEIELIIATFPAPLKSRPTWAERRKIRMKMQPDKPARNPILERDLKRYTEAMAEMRAAQVQA